MPIRIVDDFNPELEESFTVELDINSVEGGGILGNKSACKVTIDESDFPFGLLGYY